MKILHTSFIKASASISSHLFVFVLPQVDEPKYHLLLKKDKAHDMDVNSVQWSSAVKA